jgi:hypothetical protein
VFAADIALNRATATNLPQCGHHLYYYLSITYEAHNSLQCHPYTKLYIIKHFFPRDCVEVPSQILASLSKISIYNLELISNTKQRLRTLQEQNVHQ